MLQHYGYAPPSTDQIFLLVYILYRAYRFDTRDSNTNHSIRPYSLGFSCGSSPYQPGIMVVVHTNEVFGDWTNHLEFRECDYASIDLF